MVFLGLKFGERVKESEYFSTNLPQLQKFFDLILALLVIGGFVYFITDILRGSAAVYTIITIIFFALALFSFLLRKKLEKWIELLIIFFTCAAYLFVLIRNANYFFHKFDKLGVFYAGYAFGLFHQICLSRFANYYFAIALDIVNFITRTAILGIGDHYGVFLLQLALDIFRLYAIYWKEKDDRGIFASFYDSKKDLVKFKHLLSDHLPDSVLVVDISGKSLFHNESYTRNFPTNNENAFIDLEKFCIDHETLQGYSNNLPKKVVHKFRTVKDIVTRVDPSTLDPMDILSFRANTYTSEREPHKIFNMKVFSINWDQKQAVAIIFNDITDQEAISRVRIADANKQRILASVSHELRTPINGMVGILHIMENEIKEPHLLKYLGYCKTNCELLLSIVGSILDLNQIRHKTLKLFPTYFKITDLFDQIKSLFEYQCNIKGLYFKSEIDPEANQYFFTDKGRLFQVLVNLAGNAVKFTQKGGITMGYRKSETFESESILWVSDTGIGIKPQDMSKLFTVYGKLDDINANASNTNGIGLGLTISTNLVQLLNDRNMGISVESTYGYGTTFTFPIDVNLRDKDNPDVMPMLGEEDNKAETRLQLYKSPERTGNIATSADIASMNRTLTSSMEAKERRDCLIVDDNPFNLMAAKHFLELEGYFVHQALNGQEAIDKTVSLLNSGCVLNIIFMDLQMPIMDGYDATKALKDKMKEKEIPNVPIIALSANDQEHDKQKCWLVGLDDHISKPIQKDVLKKILEKFVNRKVL